MTGAFTTELHCWQSSAVSARSTLSVKMSTHLWSGPTLGCAGFGQLLNPRPPPFGFHPGYTAGYRLAGSRGSVEVQKKALQPFDGRSLFLRHGPMTRFCGWWWSKRSEEGGGKAGWLLSVQVRYGNHTGLMYGDQNVLGRYHATCMELEPKERITQLYAWTGMFIDELGFVTSKGKSHRLGHGGPELNILSAPPKACLASISGWTGKWDTSTGASYDQVRGLQFDWTTDC